jgi:arylsulfatase A-like enzyme
VAVLLAGLALVGCGRPPPPGPREPAFGAILVSIDTLRADGLGCYGHPLPTSPHIDRLQEDAILFRTAIANGPSTLVSHASIFTSLAPPQHGASVHRRRPLAPEMLTVAEVLQEHGLATVSFNGGAQLGPSFDGVDLLALVEGRTKAPPQVLSKADGGASSVRTTRWKWAQKRLYDLQEDPGEQRDVKSLHPERAAAMRRLKDDLMARGSPEKADPIEFDEELLGRLRDLGYVE